MAEVPLKAIKCGRIRKKQPNCSLVLAEKPIPKLEFICRDESNGDMTLQCENITAIDLKVEAKFGSIEAMKGTVLVECSVLEKLTPSTTGTTGNNSGTTSESSTKRYPNCLVQATFHVKETGAVRDLLRKLRTNSNLSSGTTSGTNHSESNTTRFKEGLPQWVRYIPHYLYSKRTRQCIQLAIYVYFVFSVMWALWQLYRYVGFVRESVQPLVEFLQYQYRLLGFVIEFFSALFEKYTVQWLCFIKPLYMVMSTMAAPLLQTVAQLGPVIRIVTQGITNSCMALWPVAKPVLNVGYQLLLFVFSVFRALKNTMAKLFPVFDIGTHFRAFKNMLWALWISLSQVQLDPLKVQLILVRTTIINSSRALSLGMVRLARKVYKVIWLRRSARLEKED